MVSRYTPYKDYQIFETEIIRQLSMWAWVASQLGVRNSSGPCISSRSRKHIRSYLTLNDEQSKLNYKTSTYAKETASCLSCTKLD